MSSVLTAIILAYVLGSIPSGFIFARLFRGIDVRHAGDGNVGGRNVWRTAGPMPGVLTILADVGKGVLAILLAQSLGVGQTGVYLAGLACALGHDFMPLLGFRGGQGMAVIVGAGAMLYPRELALAVVSFLILWGITRIMDIGFGVGAVTLIGAVWYTHPAADVIFLIALIPTIGIKKLWDRPAAREIAWHGNGDNPERPGLRR